MNIKIVKTAIILVLCVMLSGCSVDYNLEIKDDSATETINMTKLNDEYKVSDLDKELNNIISFNKDGDNIYAFYNMSKIIGEKQSGVRFTYKFGISSLVYESTFITTCYDKVDFSYTSAKIDIKTSDNFNCWNYLEVPFNINIKTSLVVLNNNADSIVNGVYTWNMVPGVIKKPIIIELARDPKKTNNVTSPTSANDYIQLGILVLFVVSLIAVGYYVITMSNKKNNKI